MPKDAKLFSVMDASCAKRKELPALISRVENHAVKELSKVLADVFDRADDTLFEMADRAISNSEQNLYFESMREIRIRRRGLENGFRQALENNFLVLVSGAVKQEGKASNDECSLESLSIMKNDDLEEAVAVDSMISKLRNLTSAETKKLSCRFESLLPGIKVDEENNPLGATRVVHSFTDMGAILDLDIKTKLILFKLFDARVLSHTAKLVMTANKMFVEAGVLPELKCFPSRTQRGRESPSSSQDGERLQGAELGAAFKREEIVSKAAESSLGSGLLTGVEGLEPYENFDHGAEDDGGQFGFETIQELLSLSRNSRRYNGKRSGLNEKSSQHKGNADVCSLSFDSPSSKGGAAAAVGKRVSRPNLLAMLSAIQNSRSQVIEQNRPGELKLDLKTELGRILKGQEKKLGRYSIDQGDEDVIHVVGMMFNVILEDHNLSDSMKAVIGRLQIPLVKVALLDQGFFSQSNHPARRLLNVLAKAGVGCVDESNSERDAIFCKIQTVVQEILDHENGGIALYESQLAEFNLFIKKEEKRSALIERRILDAEAGREKTDQARFEVNETIQSLMAGKEIPPVVLKLLKGAWANVLFVALLRGGKDTELWQQKLSTASDLIWSVQPESSLESKSRLLALVPRLLEDLRDGLTEVSYNPCEMSNLFSDLQALHLHLLQGKGTRARDGSEAKPLCQGGGGHRRSSRSSNGGKDETGPLGSPKIPGESSQAQASPAASKSIADITKEILEKSLNRGMSEEESDRKGVVAGHSASGSKSRLKTTRKPCKAQHKLTSKPVLASESAVSSNDESVESDHQYVAQYQQLDALGVGSWVEFVTMEGEKTRCKLAAKIASQKKFIFVNRGGVKVFERVRYELAQLMERGQFVVLDDSRLFDRALESVISNLRANQPASELDSSPDNRAG